MTASDRSFQEAVGGQLRRAPIEILQINVGKLCNQTCTHCHVDAGPGRTEIMSARTARGSLRLLDHFPSISTLDITGGAPELNPSFRELVREGAGRGLRVIDRCNLTVLLEPAQDDLGEFLAEHRVNVVASLPCYLEENVDAQRGAGVFLKSVEAIRRLNSLGYGAGGERVLDLVYNPTGLHLPPPQAELERAYKEQLLDRFGIRFDRLFTITNMAIARFRRSLARSGQLEQYQRLLADAFNSATVAQLMCRNTISVSWEGYLYDCDFNQMLDMKIQNGRPLTVHDISPGLLSEIPIQTASHCFGCTAGCGSSCAGSLVEA